MTFERSRRGQENRAAFFDADLTCYIEGVEDRERSFDVLFWSSIFRAVFPDLKVHFTCRGGKPVLQALARDLIQKDVSRTIVAMDADYCRNFEGNLISDHRVMYTFGYSWENDIYSQECLEDLYADLTLHAIVPENRKAFLTDSIEQFSHEARRPIIGDFLALAQKGSVFDRSRPGRYVIRCPQHCAKFGFSLYLSDLRAVRPSLRGNEKRNVSKPIEPTLPHLVGKVYEIAVRYIVEGCVTRFGDGNRVSANEMRRSGIATLSRRVGQAQAGQVVEHYVTCVRFAHDRALQTA